MKTEAFSLDHVDAMIDFLDKHIAANTDTPAQLGALQQRLDKIDTAYRADPAYAQFYSRMLEMQSLIYGRSNQDAKALQFMKEAVRQAGGVHGIRSKSIREYIAKHHARPAAAQGHVQAHAHNTQAQKQRPEVRPSQAVPISNAPQQHAIRHKKRRFNPFSHMRVAFAASLLVFGLVGLTLYFVPRASAVPIMLANYSEIQSAKKSYQDLTAKYRACSSQLAQERDNVDTYSTQAVGTYNQDATKCQNVLHRQEQAASKYDSLIAGE